MVTARPLLIVLLAVLIIMLMSAQCWGQPKEGATQQLNAIARLISGIVDDQAARDRMEEAAQCKDEEHTRRMLLALTIVHEQALDLKRMAWKRHDALASGTGQHDAFTRAMEGFDDLIEEIRAHLSTLRACHDAHTQARQPLCQQAKARQQDERQPT